MRTFRLFIFGAALLFAASVIGLPVASAHSFPEQETPSAGQRLSAPPSEVTIKFDAPIEKLFAKLEVLDTDGKPETAGPPQVDPTALTLSVKVAALKPGEYTVEWGVVCVDSHHTEGSYVFTVAGGG
jgi:methionine-rich copper-binding protein CopC